VRAARRLIRRIPYVNWLPTVFTPVAVILMEVLWLYPWFVWVGKMDFFTDDRPPLSLASMVLLVGASYLATRYLLSRDWPQSWVRFGIIFFGLALVYAAIRSEYHAGYDLADPQWFVHIGRTMLNSFSEMHQIMIALPATAYLWWRGIDRGRKPLLITDIYRTFLIGIGAFVLLILLWRLSLGAGSLENLASTVAPMVATFFFFALAALALVNLHTIQQRMAPDETTRTFNRRWLPTLFAVVGGVVLLGVAVSSVFSPVFMAFLHGLLDTVFDVARQVFHYILIPFGYIAAGMYYVLKWLLSFIRRSEPPEFQAPGFFGEQEEPEEAPTGEPIPDVVIMVLKWVLFAVVAIVITYFLLRAISRFRAARAGSDVEEVSESLWSWEGFKADLLLFLSTLWQRLRRRGREITGVTALPYWYGAEDEAAGARLSIREIYRRLLWQGSRFGAAHREWETPYEYDRRLGPMIPEGREQLAEITDLYVGTRYGDLETPDSQVDRANSLWETLRQLLRGPRDAAQAMSQRDRAR